MKNFINGIPLLFAIALISLSIFNKSKSDGSVKTEGVNIYSEDESTEINIGTSPIFKVIPDSIYDGDTLRVIKDNQEFKVRFACIDAPELKQDYGIESRDYLRSLLKDNNYRVSLQEIIKDRYDRTVAVLYLENGKSIQELQLINGWVYIYEKYRNDCPIYDDLKEIEEVTKSERVNLYSDDSLIKPWNFR